MTRQTVVAVEVCQAGLADVWFCLQLPEPGHRSLTGLKLDCPALNDVISILPVLRAMCVYALVPCSFISNFTLCFQARAFPPGGASFFGQQHCRHCSIIPTVLFKSRDLAYGKCSVTKRAWKIRKGPPGILGRVTLTTEQRHIYKLQRLYGVLLSRSPSLASIARGGCNWLQLAATVAFYSRYLQHSIRTWQNTWPHGADKLGPWSGRRPAQSSLPPAACLLGLQSHLQLMFLVTMWTPSTCCIGEQLFVQASTLPCVHAMTSVPYLN